MSLIAGGLTALFLFATSARALPSLELTPVSPQQATSSTTSGNGSGASSTTSTTAASTTSTTTGGNGSGASSTTSTTAGGTTSTTAGGATSSTAATTSTTAAGQPSISTTTQSVQAGGTVQVNGTGWPANTTVSFVLNSQPANLGSVQSGANGTFSIVLQVPANTTPGSHTLTASGGGRTASLTLVVSGVLAVSGLSWNLAVLGLALLAAGIIVLAGDRIGRQELIEFV